MSKLDAEGETQADTCCDLFCETQFISAASLIGSLAVGAAASVLEATAVMTTY